MAKTGGRQKKIIIIEDEEVLLDLLKNKMEKAGFSVDVARDGVAGFDLIKKAHPDIVLLDMMLPGMDGFGVLEHMKKIGLLPGLPVLIISNSGQPIETERASALGVRDHLIKVNFDPQEVLVRVEALLDAEENRGASGAGGDAEKHPSGKISRGTILIVEDDFLLEELLNRRFAKERYAAIKAVDVEQARRILETVVPDLILLDLVLPGSGGFVFLEELKRDKRTAHVPVVIISNLGRREEIAEGLAKGAADYIVKAHMSPGDIVKKVEALLKNKI